MAESSADRFQELYQQCLANEVTEVTPQSGSLLDLKKNPAIFLNPEKMRTPVEGSTDQDIATDSLYSIMKRDRIFSEHHVIIKCENSDSDSDSDEPMKFNLLLDMTPQIWYDLLSMSTVVGENANSPLPPSLVPNFLGEFARKDTNGEVILVDLYDGVRASYDRLTRKLSLGLLADHWKDETFFDRVHRWKNGPYLFQYGTGEARFFEKYEIPQYLGQLCERMNSRLANIKAGGSIVSELNNHPELRQALLELLFPQNQVEAVQGMVQQGSFDISQLTFEQLWLLLANPSGRYSLDLTQLSAVDHGIDWQKRTLVERALIHHLLEQVLSNKPVKLTEFHSPGLTDMVNKEQDRFGTWWKRATSATGIKSYHEFRAPKVAEVVHRTFLGVAGLAKQAQDIEDCAEGRSAYLQRANELRAYYKTWLRMLPEVVADHELDLRKARNGGEIGPSAWLAHEEALRQIVIKPDDDIGEALSEKIHKTLTALEDAETEVRALLSKEKQTESLSLIKSTISKP